MANNLSSNVTQKVMEVFMEKFESSRVVTKTINTQLLKGVHNPSSGDTVKFKRPHDYKSHETSDGDISGVTKSDIVAGNVSGVVQDMITVATEWSSVEEALELGQLDEILAPAATRAVTTLELNLAQFMQRRCNLSYGTPGTAIDAWSDIAGAAAMLESVGVPNDEPWYYVMNPYTRIALADVQNSLSAGDQMVKTAFEKAQLSRDFGGMMAMTSNALKSFTSGSLSDRAGAINGSPTVTYVAHKDTWIQDIPVDGFGAGADTIKAGEIVEITGKFRLNLSTREQILDASGSAVKWRGVVTEDLTLSSGGGTLKVAGPAIYESGGQYNTTNAAIADNDVITVLGAASTLYQPALFYQKNAFGIGTVKLPKLYEGDTIATTEDGFSIRCVKYSDGDTGKQKVRFDLMPAFADFNPFFAGQGFGVA